MALSSILSLALPLVAHAHIAAFGPGMNCLGGLPGQNNGNNNLPVGPLFNLTKKDWWFQHDRGCDEAPPAPGVFLEIPVGGNFTVEHANNQAFTTLSDGGKLTSTWPDGGNHPENWHGEWQNGECIPGGGWLHATNETDAQGTAFAIAYKSNLSEITMEDLSVFTVLPRTPFHRLATYQVPAGMPACPEEGCTCAHLWVPKACGQWNMYMQGFKCKTTGNVGTKKIAKAKPPRWCADGSPCVQGSKQMIVFEQLEGNNVLNLPDTDTPTYNENCGYKPGAQNDIFEDDGEGDNTTTSLSSAMQVASSAVSVSSLPATLSPQTSASSSSVVQPVSSAPAAPASPATTSAPAGSPPPGYALQTVTVFVTVTATA